METDNQVVENQNVEVQNENVQNEAEVSSTVVSTSEIATEKNRRLEKAGKNPLKAQGPAPLETPETNAVDDPEPKPTEKDGQGNDRLIKKLGRQKEEIGKKTRQNYDLRRKNAELQQRIAELEKFASQAPKRESFQNENDFLKAEIKHETKLELEKERLSADIQNANSEYHENITSRMREQLKEPESVIKFYTKYHDRIKQDEPEIYEYVTSGSKYGPIVLERFLNHTLASEEAYAEWRNTTSYARMKQINQLEGYLDSLTRKAPEQVQQRKSAAPEPIVPSKGQNPASGGEESLEAMIARAKQRRLNR